MPLVREIKFDGYNFRSKIESQWYVFFKTLGIDVHYEPETISLELFNGKIVNYLVDYHLPDLDCFVEIKLSSCPTHEESMKCYLLSVQTGKNVYMFYETIGKKNMNGYLYEGGSGTFRPLQRWTQCPKCSSFDITSQGRVGLMKCGCCKDADISNDSSFDIMNAVNTVRAERFGA